MNSFVNLLVYTLTFLLLSNFVLTRAVGTTLTVSITRNYRYVLIFGLIVTLASTLVSMPAWLLSQLLGLISWSGALEPLFYVILICGLYLGTHFALRRFFPKHYTKYSADIAQAMLNCVVMSAVSIPFHDKLTFGASVLFGFETGLAFLVASLIVLEGQKRLATSKPPRAFRGLPVMLLYLGLLAMAFYGFVGRQQSF